MKLPQLLSQYLYLTRKLDLPGIGTFVLDTEAVIPQDSDRLGQVAATGIHFQNASIATADDKLVDFIKEHTGKMKSLAAADLDFFLTTGRQLLNIGKPFYLEGIGTLIKNKEGLLDFTHGDYMVARLDESGPERRVNMEEPARERETRNGRNKQGMLLALIVAGLIAVGWGGYYVYKRNSFTEPNEKQAVVMPDTASTADSNHQTVAAPDTSKSRATVTPANPPGTNPTANPPGANPTAKTAGSATAGTNPSGTAQAGSNPASTAGTGTSVQAAAPGATLYKFVILSTDNKHHALRRYNQLLGYQLNIKMDQKDSSWFKLYFPIAAVPRDTAYIKDSLADTYAAPRVIIEH